MRRLSTPSRAGLLLPLLLAACAAEPTPEADVDQRTDPAAEEAALRAIIEQQDQPPRAEDAISWSGAYPKPMIGERGVDGAPVQPHTEARIEQRRNVQRTNEIVRLEVAESGDMAYELSNFTLSYDMADTGEHVSFPGSALRVWKRIDGEWRIVATFMRPHETPE